MHLPAVSSLWINPSEGFFLFLAFLLFHLGFPSLCFTLVIYFLSHLFLRALLSMWDLSIFIRVVLNGVIIPKLLLYLVPMLALCLPIVELFFFFALKNTFIYFNWRLITLVYICYFFLIARQGVWGKRNWYPQAFSKVVIRGVRRGNGKLALS